MAKSSQIVKNQHSCIRKTRNNVTALEEKMLLSNTEISKDIPQHLVCGDFSDDAAEVVDCFADVLGGEVGREAGGEAFADAEEGCAGIAESLGMALVCYQSCVAVGHEIVLALGED